MATIWVNFAEVRARVSLEAVLIDFYHLTNLKRFGTKLVGPCPVHNGDSPRAFHADLEKNVWHCFSKCQKGGNQLDLVSLKEGVGIREAAILLQGAFFGAGSLSDVSTPRPPSGGQQPGSLAPIRVTPNTPVASSDAEDRTNEDASEPNPPLNVKLVLSPDHPHLRDERRLRPETIQHFGVGYCPKGIMRGFIAIPIHDEGGVLVAYAGRRLRPSDIREYGKYKVPKGFRKDRVVYNLHRADAVDPTGPIVLVEGFFSVLKLFEAGIDVVGAIMGCELSEHQAKLLAPHAEVILLFDGNAAGLAGAVSAREKLAERTTVRLVRLPEGLEPDDLDPKALRWLVRGVSILNITEISFTLGPPSGA